QRRELRLVDVAAQLGPAALELARELRLLLRPRDDERQADGRRRVGRGERVLAPLDRADEEQVAVRVAVWAERGVDGVRRDDDLLRRRAVQLDQVAACPL